MTYQINNRQPTRKTQNCMVEHRILPDTIATAGEWKTTPARNSLLIVQLDKYVLQAYKIPDEPPLMSQTEIRRNQNAARYNFKAADRTAVN